MVRRLAILALLALIAGGGCNAGTSGGLARKDPPLPRDSISKTRFIAQHNKNAETIRSLKATPSIQVTADGRQFGLKGQMAMERPRDFRLVIKSTLHTQADIGSNQVGFWFWVKDNTEKAIYVCDYEHVNASPLAATMQPDWIIEAMGLREITDREAATIDARPGDKPGQLVLTQLRKDSKGETLTKETLVRESNGEIIEHRLYAGAKKELLARASIAQYQYVELLPTDEDPSGSKVAIPAKFRLDWIVEKFSLDITMGEPQVNPQFPKEQKLALFTEPNITGATRTNLAQVGRAPAATSSWIRESSPRSGIRLGPPQPEPMEVEGSIRSPRDPVPLSADLASTPAQPAGVVLAPYPQAVDPQAVQASGRRSWQRRPIEQ
jgi:hypothetical protein